MNDPQELLDTAWRHCQAIQTIIDQLTETESNTELRLLSQRLQRLYQNSQTLTSCCVPPIGTSIEKTYGGPMGYSAALERGPWHG
jgi:hypothetical protein